MQQCKLLTLLILIVFYPPNLMAKNSSLTVPVIIQTTALEDLASVEQLLKTQALNQQMKSLAKTLLATSTEEISTEDKMRMQMLLEDHGAALASYNDLRSQLEQAEKLNYLHYELLLKAKLEIGKNNAGSITNYQGKLSNVFTDMNDITASRATHFIGYSIEQGNNYLRWLFNHAKKHPQLDSKHAIRMLRVYQDQSVYSEVLAVSKQVLEADRKKRYLIEDDILIGTPDGAKVSAIVVRSKNLKAPSPSAMMFNIYTDYERNLNTAIDAASRGYIGVVADARGKRLSPSKITPNETEVIDVNAVIDWISKQTWSNGEVGMFGGSYLGFSQWAATKNIHPALKTIVPYVAAIPGQGLPMENNIFLNANYQWAFHVTNNKTVDDSVYNTPERWRRLNQQWYQQGGAYRNIDKIDGKANPWLQKWLDHPAYDEYWQAMVPYQKDYRKINIPVLSITGYYDDGQISAIHYLSEHYKYNPNANHYLLIGPYDHQTAQATQQPELRGYQLDKAAFVNVPELTFEWFDYVLKSAPKPALIKDKINYQLMGDNSWRHAKSLDALHSNKQRFYLTTEPSQQYFALSTSKKNENEFAEQIVDLADRQNENNEYYPWPIVKPKLEVPNGLAYISPPMQQDMELSGRISGKLKVTINKKDFDVGLVFYEMMPDGKIFHLSYYLGRASYAKDMTQRHLLSPGQIESVPFERTRMVSKVITKGSRLVVLANVNKNRFAQINYGTGKDVNDETIADAKQALTIRWHNSSYVDFPLKPVN